MGIIHVLDFSVANLIAAGEVVDRPASAIKEMIENSMDARATTVTVETKNGGSTFMRVTDDGCGMEKEDVPLCIRRHATSKITTEQDLNAIGSYGFRGEALAALSSVSDLRIISRREEDEMGTLFSCESGKVVEYCQIGCPKGTTVIAENLFANVPARRNFLKKDATETAAVVSVCEKMALSHPEISMRLITDGEMRFNTAGDGKLSTAIYAVFGREFVKKLIPVEDMTDFIEIRGYIGRPDLARGNRNQQIFFVNGRYVKSPVAQSALEQAFVSYCPAEKFPVAVLFITIPPAFVDVNVHPAKMEVKFSASAKVFDAIYAAVRNALSLNLTRPDGEKVGKLWLSGEDVRKLGVKPNLRAESEEEAVKIAAEEEEKKAKYEQISAFEEIKPKEIPPVAPVIKKEEKTDSAPLRKPPEPEKPVLQKPEEIKIIPEEKKIKTEEIKPVIPEKSEPVPEENPNDFSGWSFSASEFVSAPEREKPQKTQESADRIKIKSEEKPEAEKPEQTTEKETEKPENREIPLPWHRTVGVLFNCYVVVELADKMLMIDKHAAHERVLYEEMKRNLTDGALAPQLLLLPLTPVLSSQEIAAAEEYRKELSDIGFDFTVDAGKRRLEITQVPGDMEKCDPAAMFTDLASSLSQELSTPESARRAICEKALFQHACKAAVKAGREDQPETIEYIVEAVLRNPEIRFCPHGRPVALEMTKSEVAHLFARP